MAAERYDPAGPDDYKLLRSVMADRFPDMLHYEPELRITILMASGAKVPCLTAHGCPTSSDVKVTRADERASNPDAPDVRFYFDHPTWMRLGEERRRSGLAMLLRYLDVKLHPGRVDQGSIMCQQDDYGRPIVGKNAPDYLTAGFVRDVEEFGDDSWELVALKQIAQDIGQDVFDFIKAAECDVYTDPASQSAVADRVAEIERGETGEPDVARETFAALLSVGHTDEQARAAIDRAMESRRRFDSVSEMIEAIYADSRERGPVLAESDPAPASVSFSGRDIDVIADVGKKLRRQARMAAAE